MTLVIPSAARNLRRPPTKERNSTMRSEMTRPSNYKLPDYKIKIPKFPNYSIFSLLCIGRPSNELSRPYPAPELAPFYQHLPAR
jgi:hypothetical protein